MPTIYAFTDGACKFNPGPMGIGIVIIKDGKVVNQISHHIGHGTNNIAELTAIKVALSILENETIPIVLSTDSQYSINVLTRFKAKTNVELILSIKQMMLNYKPGIMLKYVPGHSKIHYNEMADSLATSAIKNMGRPNVNKEPTED